MKTKNEELIFYFSLELVYAVQSRKTKNHFRRSMSLYTRIWMRLLALNLLSFLSFTTSTRHQHLRKKYMRNAAEISSDRQLYKDFPIYHLNQNEMSHQYCFSLYFMLVHIRHKWKLLLVHSIRKTTFIDLLANKVAIGNN